MSRKVTPPISTCMFLSMCFKIQYHVTNLLFNSKFHMNRIRLEKVTMIARIVTMISLHVSRIRTENDKLRANSVWDWKIRQLTDDLFLTSFLYSILQFLFQWEWTGIVGIILIGSVISAVVLFFLMVKQNHWVCEQDVSCVLWNKTWGSGQTICSPYLLQNLRGELTGLEK